MEDDIDPGEFAEMVAMLLRGELGDPARYVELHGWDVIALDIGEIEIRSRTQGAFRLAVTPLTD
jgi:hypothetical protein